MIYLDSASAQEARTAQELGYVRGITTNPKLIALTGKRPLAQLELLVGAFSSGPVFYQPVSTKVSEARDELEKAVSLAPDRIVPKLPAQRDMFRLVGDLVADGYRCAVTGTYTASQVVVAATVGADWVIPYVDRARRLRPDVQLVRQLSAVLSGRGGDTGILAASIKSPEQAIGALLDGAQAVSAPLDVVLALPDDPLTDSAVEEFVAAYLDSQEP